MAGHQDLSTRRKTIAAKKFKGGILTGNSRLFLLPVVAPRAPAELGFDV
jgi:hypothetical protein